MTKKKIKDDTIARMKALGVFKPEFEDAIDTYADLYFQYKNISKQFNKNIKNEEKCKAVIVEYSAAGTAKQAPIIRTLENLRKDLLQYSDRLCLNPRIYQTLNIQQDIKENNLAAILKKIED